MNKPLYAVREIPIADLKPAEYNPRRLTEKQFSDLKKSMTELGTLEPAIVNTYPGRELVIIGGHQRIKVATAMGLITYPCHEVSFPPEKEREANIRLNKNRGEWDMDILANEFDTKDLMDWGFESLDFGLGPDVSETEFPALSDAAEKGFQNMTFILSNEQAEEIKRAIDAAKSEGAGEYPGNENSNGNAIHHIAAAFLTGHAGR